MFSDKMYEGLDEDVLYYVRKKKARNRNLLLAGDDKPPEAAPKSPALPKSPRSPKPAKARSPTSPVRGLAHAACPIAPTLRQQICNVGELVKVRLQLAAVSKPMDALAFLQQCRDLITRVIDDAPAFSYPSDETPQGNTLYDAAESSLVLPKVVYKPENGRLLISSISPLSPEFDRLQRLSNSRSTTVVDVAAPTAVPSRTIGVQTELEAMHRASRRASRRPSHSRANSVFPDFVFGTARMSTDGAASRSASEDAAALAIDVAAPPANFASGAPPSSDDESPSSDGALHSLCQALRKELRAANDRAIQAALQNELLTGKLATKTRAMQRTKETLYKEVCLLREQLYQCTQNPKYNPEGTVTLMDLAFAEFEDKDADLLSALHEQREEVSRLHKSNERFKLEVLNDRLQADARYRMMLLAKNQEIDELKNRMDPKRLTSVIKQGAIDPFRLAFLGLRDGVESQLKDLRMEFKRMRESLEGAARDLLGEKKRLEEVARSYRILQASINQLMQLILPMFEPDYNALVRDSQAPLLREIIVSAFGESAFSVGYELAQMNSLYSEALAYVQGVQGRRNTLSLPLHHPPTPPPIPVFVEQQSTPPPPPPAAAMLSLPIPQFDHVENHSESAALNQSRRKQHKREGTPSVLAATRSGVQTGATDFRQPRALPRRGSSYVKKADEDSPAKSRRQKESPAASESLTPHPPAPPKLHRRRSRLPLQPSLSATVPDFGLLTVTGNLATSSPPSSPSPSSSSHENSPFPIGNLNWSFPNQGSDATPAASVHSSDPEAVDFAR